MEGKSLELVTTESRIGDTILALEKYLKPSKSVLTEDAINTLFSKVKQCPEVDIDTIYSVNKKKNGSKCTSLKYCFLFVYLPYVVKWFDDFISNQQMQQEWLPYFNELTQLCRACLDDTISFSAHRMDICRIFRSLGGRGEPLSSTLFNMCAGKFLQFIDSSFTDMEIIDLLSVLTILCRISDHSCIAQTIELQSYRIQKVAARSFSLSVDAQIGVYWFLMGVIYRKEDAHEKAFGWYPYWPNIQHIFFDYYPNNMSEGCGVFLEELGRPSNERPSSTSEIYQLPNSQGSFSDTSEILFWDEPPSSPEVPRHSILASEGGKTEYVLDPKIDQTSFSADSPIFKSSQLKSSTQCTTASVIDTPPAATVNLSKISEKFALPKASSFSRHCPPLEIGDDFSLPVVPLKKARNFFLDKKKGNWRYKIKKHPNTQRWPSFKWANSEKNGSLGKGKPK